MTSAKQAKPISPELQIREAKARLRSSAQRMSPGPFYREHPKLVLGLAFSAGTVLAVSCKRGRETASLLQEAAGLFRALNFGELIQQLFHETRGGRS